MHACFPAAVHARASAEAAGPADICEEAGLAIQAECGTDSDDDGDDTGFVCEGVAADFSQCIVDHIQGFCEFFDLDDSYDGATEEQVDAYSDCVTAALPTTY